MANDFAEILVRIEGLMSKAQSLGKRNEKLLKNIQAARQQREWRERGIKQSKKRQ